MDLFVLHCCFVAAGLNGSSMGGNKGMPTGAQGKQILENIIQLAELLDDEALDQMPEVCFLELAKAVSFGKKETATSQPFSGRRLRNAAS